MTTNGKERTMRPSTRRFSRGRITGLTLIAVLTLGLGYLHFAGSSTAVSVPAGAHAGQLTITSAPIPPKRAPPPRIAGRSWCPRTAMIRTRA